jgi:hypothetical protein
MRIIILLLLIFAILVGCYNEPKYQGFLTKEEVLEMDPKADVFELDGKAYKANIDWINDEELTKDEQVGEITEGMATELPEGAKIYSTKERGDILIAEFDEIEKRYLLMLGE